MLALADNPVAQSFLGCLARAKHVAKPFDYCLLKGALPEAEVDGILALPVTIPSDAVFNGRRETNNAQRIFFGREAQERFAVCRRVAEGFKDARVIAAIERATGARLAHAAADRILPGRPGLLARAPH
jgi:hypothetical protein